MRRGTTEGAACADCPFSLDGQPARPVLAEIPDAPRWILVGEGPGRTETFTNRQFCGALQLVDKMLAKVGRRRDDIVLTTAYLCQATEGADEAQRHRAAAACKGRLAQELAEFPKMPVLSLGAVAAKALIPPDVIDAIDPPNVSKAKKRSQKERQRAEAKALAKALRVEEQATAAHARAQAKQAAQTATLAAKRLAWLTDRERTQIRARLMRPLDGQPFRARKPPRKHVIDEYVGLVKPRLTQAAYAWAVQQWKVTQRMLLAADAHATANPTPAKARKAAKVKPKTFKLANVLSTCLEVDADGTGVLRPLVPSIHPATLTSGGGASIRGAHTPDLGFINLYYDAGKVDGLSRGQDLWLKLNVEVEFTDADRAAQLLVDLLDEAVAEGEVALDLETYVDDPERHHALMAYMARIRTLGLATQGRAISVWWDLLPPWALSRLQAVLGSERVTKVYHNGLYDRTVLMGNGYALAGPWEDTLLAHHAGFPGCAHNLQTVTAQFFAVAPWKSTYKNAEESPERLTRYNAQDTAATRALRPALTLRVQRTRTEQVYALDKRMSEIATKMHLVGMPVSREVNAELRRVFLANIRQAKQVVEAAAADPAIQAELHHQIALEEARTQRRGDPDGHRERYDLRLAAITRLVDAKTWRWKITAGKHIAALLQAGGAGLTATSGGGALSTKRDVLEQLTHVKVVRDILAYRENEKLYATFVGPIFDQERDGDVVYGYADARQRIHPIWSVHKITGRWGSAEPVVSNVPKDKWKALAEPAGLVWTPEGAGCVATDAHGIPWRKDAKGKIVKRTRPNLRAQVVAPPGRVFIGFDFCLAKGTLIDTPLGHRPIEQLRAGDLVYSYNEATHRPACSRVVHQAATGVRPTVVVVLDNGERVRCTPDHRWLVRVKGTEVREVQAQDLTPGTRLLPLRRNKAGKPGQDYETLYSYSAFQYVKTHRAVAEAAHGPRPEGAHVHHLDGDRFNNRPENLTYVDAALHLREHGTVAATAQWQRSDVRAKMQAGIAKAIKDRGGHGGANNPNHGKRTGVEGTCPQCGVASYFGGKHPKRFCSRACYHAFRRANPQPRGTAYHDLNHKVVEVIRDGISVETFDIEVERDHNFALAAGVFVHNCQLEARIIALISGDPFLCQVFADGLDIHRECARVVFPSFDTMGKDEQKMARDQTKPLEYGAFYGGSVETLWRTIVKERPQAKLADIAAAVGSLMGKMSGVVAWQRMTVARASQPPYEIREFLYGRTRTFPLGQVEPTEAMNFGVQAAAASIMNTGMERMDRALDGYKQAFAIAQIHDAAVFECWEDDAEALQADVIRCFTQEYERDGRTIPFPVEAAIGKSWAEV